MTGPFAQTTRHDPLPLDQYGGAADTGGDAADTSAATNIDGANTVTGNATAETQEIAAVPDPTSPAGQAAILAIIEKYQAKSSGAVESAATDQQAEGAKAAGDTATHHHHSDDDEDDGDDRESRSGSSGLMDILGQLLGAGGSGLGGGGIPFEQGGSPFGSAMGGANPFGDPYGTQTAGTAAPAANPFAEPPQTAATTTSQTSADPSAASPASTTNAEPASNPTTDTSDPDRGTDTSPPPRASGAKTAGGQEHNAGGLDLDAFGGGDGSGVPADPATTN